MKRTLHLTAHARIAGALLSSCLAFACSEAPAPLGTGAQPIVYGDDDRSEVFTLQEAEPAYDVATRSVLAMVPRGNIVEVGGHVELKGPTWMEDRGLCPGVRFGEQPAFAACSAVLVDDDLVLTAAHCALLCSESRLVFGAYYDAPDHLHSIDASDVFDCVDVLADTKTGSLDFAWLRLDRPVGPEREPARLRSTRPTVGERLTLVGFPSGIPMKVDAGGIVSDVSDGVFHTSNDAFEGSSGSPLLDELGRVTGILAGGARDLALTGDGCYAPTTVDGSAPGMERASSAGAALAALCDETTDTSLCPRDGEGGPAESPGACSFGPITPSGSKAWPGVLVLCLSGRRRRRARRNAG